MSRTAWTNPATGVSMNPLDSVPPIIPFLALPSRYIYRPCSVAYGTFVMASKVASPTEDPKDWVGAVVADAAPPNATLGEISSGLVQALGGTHDTVFRVYPDINLFPKWQWGTAQGIQANLQ